MRAAAASARRRRTPSLAARALVATGRVVTAARTCRVRTPERRRAAAAGGRHRDRRWPARRPSGSAWRWSSRGAAGTGPRKRARCPGRPARGGAKEPAVYRRDAHDVARSTAELIARLDRYTEVVWRTEPHDVAPPAPALTSADGALPGIFYACFNLFWLGEEIADPARQGQGRRVSPWPCSTSCSPRSAARHVGSPLQVVSWSTCWSCSATSGGLPGRRPRLREPRRVPRACRAPHRWPSTACRRGSTA